MPPRGQSVHKATWCKLLHAEVADRVRIAFMNVAALENWKRNVSSIGYCWFASVWQRVMKIPAPFCIINRDGTLSKSSPKVPKHCSRRQVLLADPQLGRQGLVCAKKRDTLPQIGPSMP